MDLQFKTRTPDGRTLDVYVGGPERAVPVLFHTGTPSSGQLQAPFVEAAAQRGLRMVSFSRAGYGGSTPNPGRSVADVVPDAAAVIDQLGAHRFYTLGWSGGGPHALACAALLPARLIGAATVGSLAPSHADGLDWMAGMGQENMVVLHEGSIAVVDFAWPPRLKAIEIDGLVAHATARQLEEDLLRQDLIFRAGWQLRRFSARTVLQHPALVQAEIAHFLAA